MRVLGYLLSWPSLAQAKPDSSCVTLNFVFRVLASAGTFGVVALRLLAQFGTFWSQVLIEIGGTFFKKINSEFQLGAYICICVIRN